VKFSVSDRFRKQVLASFLVGALIGVLSSYNLAWQSTGSVPCKLFIVKRSKTLPRDVLSLVAFSPPEKYGPLYEVLDLEHKTLVKYAYGRPGDYIQCFSDLNLPIALAGNTVCEINGTPVHVPLHPALYVHRVPTVGFLAAAFAPFGSSATSYDVRLAGPVPLNLVKGYAVVCLL